MKIIVTHRSPDLDAITSAWLIKRFLPGWEDAEIQFVPAGKKLSARYIQQGDEIEKVELLSGKVAEVIHTDTGLGKLDHHQTLDNNVCAASLTFEYVKSVPNTPLTHEIKIEALEKLIQLVIDEDHFQEVYYTDSKSYLYEFTVARLIDGYKHVFPKEDASCAEFIFVALDALLHWLEQKLWAEREIEEKGIAFKTRWGKAVAVESVNDVVLEIIQKRDAVIAVRRDPNHGFVRIKAKPVPRDSSSGTYGTHGGKTVDIDLTPVYEKLKELDPHATWFLHVSKKMLLNGSTKNPEMRGTKLTLSQVIEVLKTI